MKKPRRFNWLFVILIGQILVNLIGALGPELGFDALWYHLTEAKLFWRPARLIPFPATCCTGPACPA